MMASATIIETLTTSAATDIGSRRTPADRLVIASHDSTPSALRTAPVKARTTKASAAGMMSDEPKTMASAEAYANTGRPATGPSVANHAAAASSSTEAQ